MKKQTKKLSLADFLWVKFDISHNHTVHSILQESIDTTMFTYTKNILDEVRKNSVLTNKLLLKLYIKTIKDLKNYN